jgi:hypothetical protein
MDLGEGKKFQTGLGFTDQTPGHFAWPSAHKKSWQKYPLKTSVNSAPLCWRWRIIPSAAKLGGCEGEGGA